MMINPNSVTALTEETKSTNSASNANHGATGKSNNTGATPGPSSTGGVTARHARRGDQTIVQPNPVPAGAGESRISRESKTAA